MNGELMDVYHKKQVMLLANILLVRRTAIEWRQYAFELLIDELMDEPTEYVTEMIRQLKGIEDD